MGPLLHLLSVTPWGYKRKWSPPSHPYILMPKSVKGWHKQWFYLRNNADVPLPAFTGNHPTPHHNWGYGVAKMDISKLQPMCEVIQ
jgi:hypothetical protein